jgi:hypothetical protein
MSNPNISFTGTEDVDRIIISYIDLDTILKILTFSNSKSLEIILSLLPKIIKNDLENDCIIYKEKYKGTDTDYLDPFLKNLSNMKNYELVGNILTILSKVDFIDNLNEVYDKLFWYSLYNQKTLEVVFKNVPPNYDWNGFDQNFGHILGEENGDVNYGETLISILNAIINTNTTGPIPYIIEYWECFDDEYLYDELNLTKDIVVKIYDLIDQIGSL